VMSLDEFIQLISSDITHKTVVWAISTKTPFDKAALCTF
jgi:hypothetical protein